MHVYITSFPQNHEGKVKELEGRNKSIIIIGNFITSFSIMDRTTRWKVKSKEWPMNAHYKPGRLNKHTVELSKLELYPRMQGGGST